MGRRDERETSVVDERDGELDWLGVFAELGCWRRGWRRRLVFASCLALLTPSVRGSPCGWLSVAVAHCHSIGTLCNEKTFALFDLQRVGKVQKVVSERTFHRKNKEVGCNIENLLCR